MKGKDHKRRFGLSDILKYSDNSLSGKEKNSIEREFQKDPFAAEAAEGFSLIGKDEARKDLSELERSLSAKTSHRSAVLWYRIAASVAVLMILSSVYIFVRKTDHTKTRSEIALNAPVLEVRKPEAVVAPQKKDKEVSMTSDAVISAGQKEGKEEQTGAASGIPVEETAAGIRRIRNVSINEALSDTVIISKKAVNKSEPVESILSGRVPGLTVQGRIMSAEDNLPIPGAIVRVKNSDQGVMTDTGGNFKMKLNDKQEQTLVADYIGMESKEFRANPDSDIQVKMTPSAASLSEVVVVGYGVSKKSNVAGTEVSLENGYKYLSPEPEGGRKDFDKYVENNIRKPGSFVAGQKEIVVVSFTVTESGSVQDIRIIKSPGKEYSDEAIRLIKDGPVWKPAEKNGEKISDGVRLRIVFR